MNYIRYFTIKTPLRNRFYDVARIIGFGSSAARGAFICEGSPVPVVFGQERILGKILYVGVCTWVPMVPYADAITRYRDCTNDFAALAPVWFGICMGKISIVDIFANDKVLESGVDYLSDRFNDGTGSFKPDGITNPVATKMNGVAHILFDWIDGQPNQWYGEVVLNEDITIPKMIFDVKRDLSSLPIVNTDLYLTVAGSPMFVGNNPAAVVYELLTNKQYGIGLDTSYIDLTSFNYVAALFDSPEFKSYSRIYGLNLVISELTPVVDILEKIKVMTDIPRSIIVLSIINSF